ncbi:MAG TPA: hypothetical protein VEU62_13995 [Bryobacterales bacterium]|nr:hypothetical protein [Bryobacterales bacterium]
MRNLTLALDEDLLLQARKLALDRRTTVNQLVRDYLLDLVSRERQLRRARSRLKRAFARGIVEIGRRTWKRDDLYERRSR